MAVIWDTNKNLENLWKHGVAFEEAKYVFLDYDCIQRHDDDHSDNEERWQLIGMSRQTLFVVYTERGDDTLLITARKAGPKERRIYYGDRTKYPRGWYRVNP